MMCVCVC